MPNVLDGETVSIRDVLARCLSMPSSRQDDCKILQLFQMKKGLMGAIYNRVKQVAAN